jgi:hypothetical protein
MGRSLPKVAQGDCYENIIRRQIIRYSTPLGSGNRISRFDELSICRLGGQ